ncbi:MAG: hypothetical protein D6731_21900 [Planctomycetota bacterium]|nr:MAG: hypothetical protein D6731_21900 [Planctomycetota bacterium]
MADGTDFEALPFVRVDRTEPGVTRVDVPPLLLSVDCGPSSRRKETGDRKAPTPPEDDEERDWLVRFLYPFGRYVQAGGRQSLTLTGFLADDGSANSGPAGRALSSDEEVRKDLFPSLTADAASGGVRFIPFVFNYSSYDHGDLEGVEGLQADNDISLSPFFMAGWGEDPEGDDDYLAVAPFGGVTKGLLGKKRITWFGFPYPLYAKVEDRSYDSHHVLFPLINWIDGPRNSGFRILPFYGHYERRGLRGNPIYERTYVLWPFFTHSRSGLDQEVPTETLFLFPFYGKTTAPDLWEVTVLWPFFKYTEREEDEGTRWNLRAPFPFFEVGGGPGRYQFDLWPLFGFKGREGFDRQFFLWPVFRHELMSGKKTWYEGYWILPFFWRTYWEETDTGRIRHKWRGYPFVHWRRQYDGERELELLSPWPYEDPGWDRILAPFFRIYRYHRDADGGVEQQFLWGLFSYRNLPADPERGRAAYFRLSFLFGLFQYRNLGGERGLRFLWLPELVTWGERRERGEP